MKKIIILLAVALLYTQSHMASAASTANATAPTTLKGFNATKDVNLRYGTNSLVNAWSAASAHYQGDREYATTSAFGGIAFKTVSPGSTNGTVSPSAPNSPTDSTVPSGYTKM